MNKNESELFLSVIDDKKIPQELRYNKIKFLASFILDQENLSFLADSKILKNKIQSEKQIMDNYNLVTRTYNLLLESLYRRLNKLHSETFSLRQWEIIIGPWLKLYLDNIFVRVDLISNAILKNNINNIILLEDDCLVNIPNPDSRDHYGKLMKDVYLNQIILSRIITLFKRYTNNSHLKLTKVSFEKSKEFSYKKSKNNFITNFSNFFSNILKLILEKFSNYFCLNRSIVINNPYLALIDQIRLAISIKKLPVFYFLRNYKKNLKIKKNFNRSELSLEIENSSFFDLVATHLLKYLLPSCYLEEWQNLKLTSNNLNLPKNTTLIYTGSSVSSDEYFRFYISQQISNKSKYIISQHGGVYGVTLLPPKAEFYEHNVADKWLSWGWKKDFFKNVFPSFNIKNLRINNSKIINKNANNLLLAMPGIRFFPSEIIYSDPIKVLSVHKTFIDSLSSDIKSKFILRPVKNHRNEKYVKYLSKNITLSKEKYFWSDIKKSKIFVCTHNATTILETLAANFPTIIILSGVESLIRNEAKEFYEKLKNVKILFNDPEEAADHINRIWENVDDWWKHKDVQNAVNYFCNRYSRTSKNSFKEFISLFVD